MERYKKLFLDESMNHLRAVEDWAVGSGGFDRPALDALFREIHSLKGMAASMGYTAMAALAHRFEDRLDTWRRADRPPPETARDLCLKVCDRLAQMREDVAEGRPDGRDWADLAPELAPQDEVPQDSGLDVRIGIDPDSGSPAARAYLILLRFRELDPSVRSKPSESEILQGASASELRLTLHGVTSEEVKALYDTLTEVSGLSFGAESPAPPERPMPEPAPAGAPETAVRPPQAASDETRVRLPDTVQVPVHLLDDFVDILGEMTIARSHMEDSVRALASEILREEVDRLGKLVRAFHERVMALRMLPFSLITGGLKRLVREHAAKLGKEVELRVSGEEIGLDKSILIHISDPLVHLLRNALDHGIETPEERRQRGVAARGTIEVRAARTRNRVEVSVVDDGHGIDVEAVRLKAVEVGYFREEESRRLSPQEILACLFRPGFTTREAVTELSGRGVGLDVVKSRVEALGGTIELRAHPGGGTEVHLSLPQSVAIVPVLLVEVGANALAFPTASVVRTVEAQARDIRKRDGDPVLLTEHGQVPILSLARVLRLQGRKKFQRVPLALVQTRSGVRALAVDRFLREEDLFIKPLRGRLRVLRGISGYSVLGDGRLVFLLDPPTLFGD